MAAMKPTSQQSPTWWLRTLSICTPLPDRALAATKTGDFSFLALLSQRSVVRQSQPLSVSSPSTVWRLSTAPSSCQFGGVSGGLRVHVPPFCTIFLDGTGTIGEEEVNDGSGSNAKGGSHLDSLTPAEKRYMEQRQKIDMQKMAKTSNKSHRDRLSEFNQYLANMSEHYDIPKVGPG
ncbi:hypothetical protein E3N88_43111 [Mikania micrantha]|uniref:Uncharacterized protein n=1 Tax=Mikania micrantha TaxID=192012 RepID=A0A5N6LFU1_9ASTR|nr:hypothetical protein E3N88_43111 [Mikania micrantha]